MLRDVQGHVHVHGQQLREVLAAALPRPLVPVDARRVQKRVPEHAAARGGRGGAPHRGGPGDAGQSAAQGGDPHGGLLAERAHIRAQVGFGMQPHPQALDLGRLRPASHHAPVAHRPHPLRELQAVAVPGAAQHVSGHGGSGADARSAEPDAAVHQDDGDGAHGHQQLHAGAEDAGARERVRRAGSAPVVSEPGGAVPGPVDERQSGGPGPPQGEEAAAQNDVPGVAARQGAAAGVRGGVHGESGEFRGGVREREQPEGAAVRRVPLHHALEADAHEPLLGEDLPGRAVHGAGRGREVGGRAAPGAAADPGHRSAQGVVPAAAHAERRAGAVALHGAERAGDVHAVAAPVAPHRAHGGAQLGDVLGALAMAGERHSVAASDGDLRALRQPRAGGPSVVRVPRAHRLAPQAALGHVAEIPQFPVLQLLAS